jgi:hypothetical protein
MSKKKDKSILHATNVWEREQLQAAALLSEIEKAAAIIDGHRAELSDAEYLDVADHIDQRRADVADFLLKARDKYVAKCHELGVEPVLPKDPA